jgi:hypothetical protein
MSSQGSTGTAAYNDMGNTHELLEQWGRWIRAGRPEVLDCNSMFKLGSTVPNPIITDEEALIVDAIVARLLRRRPEMGRAVMLYYGRGWGLDKKVGEHLRPKRSESAARYIRHAAVNWIDGVIEEKMHQ